MLLSIKDMGDWMIAQYWQAYGPSTAVQALYFLGGIILENSIGHIN